LDEIDPAFNLQYDASKHGEKFCEEFHPSPLLTAEENEQLADLIKEFWPVFDDTGLFIPIKDYECVRWILVLRLRLPSKVSITDRMKLPLCANASLPSKSLVIYTKFAMVHGYSKLSLILSHTKSTFV
jgi:hypothetical protein